MSSFKDLAGRVWNLRIDVDAIRRVRSAVGFDLATLFTEKGLAGIGDPVLLVDILWTLCEAQANALHVSTIDFVRGLSGDNIEEAAAALTDAAIDFLPSARQEVMRKLLSRATELVAVQGQLLAEKLEAGLAGPSPQPSPLSTGAREQVGAGLAAESSGERSGSCPDL